MKPWFNLLNETTYIEVRVTERVIGVEPSPAGFRDEISVHRGGGAGGLRQWRSGRYRCGVDDSPHRLGFLA